MRNILFRGFHNDENGEQKAFVNGEWVKGFWIHGNLLIDNDKHFYIMPFENVDYDFGYLDACKLFKVIYRTVCQYTGLKDKNGKKIFEGDIIDISDCEYIPHWINETKIKVQWDIERAGFDPFCEDAIDCREYVSADEVEVIGNIFENPELIEGV